MNTLKLLCVCILSIVFLSGCGSGAVEERIAPAHAAEGIDVREPAGRAFFAKSFLEPGAANALLNPDFEGSSVSWTMSSGVLTSDTAAAHGGSQYAWLGGYNSADDSVSQSVSIPAGASAASLQFWYRITTNESSTATAYDFMRVYVKQAATDATLATLKTFSNLNPTNGWVQSEQIDLSAYKGQSIKLQFAATTDSSLSTSFLLDDVSLMIGAGAGASAASYATAVQQLYIAYFGRPADPSGLANFSAALAAANAPTTIQGLNTAYTTSAAVKSLVDAFGTSAESNALYSGGTSAFVNAIFQNVLNRAAASSGLQFWTNAIDSGTLTRGNAALSIMAGALSNATAQGLIDAQVVNNKVAVGTSFTAALTSTEQINAYRGASAAATVRTMLAGVTNATNTSTFQSAINSTVQALVSAAPPTTPSVSPFVGSYTISGGDVTVTFVVERSGSISSCFSETSVVCSGSVSSSGTLNLTGNDGLMPVDTAATLAGTITSGGSVSGTYSGTSVSEGPLSGSFSGSRTSTAIPQAAVPTAQPGEASGDVSADTQTIGRLQVGTPVSGSLVGNDRSDWYAITLTAGVHYTIDLQGTANQNILPLTPSLSLHDSAGGLVTRTTGIDTGTTTSARIEYTPSSSGVYYVAILGEGMNYTLSVSSTGLVGTIPAGGWIGWIQIGNTETYNPQSTIAMPLYVYLVAGRGYQFDISSFSLSTGRRTIPASLLDPSDVMKVSSASPITYTPTTTGVHKVLMPIRAGSFSVNSKENPGSDGGGDEPGGGGDGGGAGGVGANSACQLGSATLGNGPVIMLAGKSSVPTACHKNRRNTFGWTTPDGTVSDACRAAQNPARNGDLEGARNISACYCYRNGKVNTLTVPFLCWTFFDS